MLLGNLDIPLLNLGSSTLSLGGIRMIRGTRGSGV